MLIQHLTLHSNNINAQATFFSQTLGFTIIAISDYAVTIKVGQSWLTFEQNDVPSRYHYAFDIPENQLDEARAWLAARIPILTDCVGQSHFEFTDWNAEGFYFCDADGNVAEFIARHNLPTASNLPFGVDSVLRISEIGLATANVIETVDKLQQQTGLRVWRGAGSDAFTAMGDETGLLIVVQQGRMWLPTQDTPAQPLPTRVHITGISKSYEVEELPYTLLSTSVIPAYVI